MKAQIKQIIYFLVIILVFSSCEDNDSASITKSNSKEITSFKVSSAKINLLSQDVTAAISQRQILQAILEENPNNTLDWNLGDSEDLGKLTGVITNTQGRIIKLNLDEKELSVLPSEIGQLTSLRHLNLSSNRLTSIPREIKNLINLKYLNLNFNGLEEIPQEISLIPALEEIGLFE
ncbi:MAG: leucine-rich repeat domain-containing protein [Flavobacteriaceae bacterium]|nr:leucine-rich repeat domain-containing protein [Flavobacteriaceae bacterium]